MGETMWQMKLRGRDVRAWAALPMTAAASLLVVVPAAGAAPAPTQLTLAGPAKAVAAGGKAKLTATLTSAGKPLKGKSVSFLSGTTEIGKATTDSKGRATKRTKLTVPATFVARFAPTTADAAAYIASESPPVALTPAAAVSVGIDTYLRAGRRAVGIPRSPVRVRGSVAPFTAGAGLELSVFRGPRRVLHETRRVTASRDGRGKFALWIKPTRRGVYRVTVRQPGAAVADSARLYVVRPGAHPGSRGTGVRALQHRLKDLGYVTPINGHYGGSTARAVLAFRKVNGFSRTTSAGRTVFRRLANGGGGFKARYPKAGKHVEFDWSRQVVALLRGSRPQIVIHTSSGAPSTPTVLGKYRFYRKHPGYNAKGMYYSVYFVGGYAIHGFSPVPTYPASHGCLRIPIATAKRVYGWVSLGDPIYTYK
jgi:hypothetical protein